MKRYIDNLKDAIVFEEVVSCVVDFLDAIGRNITGVKDDMERASKLASLCYGDLYNETIQKARPIIEEMFKGTAELISKKDRNEDEEERLYLNFILLAGEAMLTYTEYMFRSLDYQKTADRMVSIYRKKNADYGNSFDSSLDEDGLLVAKIRIGDKVRRLLSLTGENAKEAQVKDESIADTLLDLANYCLMTIVYINNNKTSKEQ